MTTEHAKELLKRYRIGLCTAEEKAAIEKWVASLADSGEWKWTEAEEEVFHAMVQTRIDKEIDEMENLPAIAPRRFKFLYVAAAIVGVLMIGTAVYTMLTRQLPKKEVAVRKVYSPVKQDVSPGINGAILTLSNGEKIVLDSAGTGTLATQSDVKIINKRGQLVYDTQNVPNSEVVYNTITTPRARQFTLQLSDGTKVWLNAASSIRYPVRFAPGNRTVEISGEVYFEVASRSAKEGNAKVPFLVKILSAAGEDDGTVKVTGTHFNINAYADEPCIKTTLIEGAIKFTKGTAEKLLVPGQQAQLSRNGLIKVLKDVNVATEIAWKNGYFTYDKTDIQTVMRQLSRWYDIDVDYENGIIPDDKYWGDIERHATLSNVFKVLEMSGVKFRIEGKKVTVIKGVHG